MYCWFMDAKGRVALPKFYVFNLELLAPHLSISCVATMLPISSSALLRRCLRFCLVVAAMLDTHLQPNTWQ